MTARIARRRIVGTTAAGLLVLGLAAGCGSSDDDSGSTTTTEADAESTTTTEAGVATTTSAPDGSTTTAASGEAAGGEPTIDGGSSVTSEVAGGTAPVEFSVSVPDGVRARLTATPDGDYDIVVEGNGQVVDGGGRGEPETVLIIGPDDFTLEVHGLLAHSAGTFTVTIERAS